MHLVSELSHYYIEVTVKKKKKRFNEQEQTTNVGNMLKSDMMG